jgi:VanZ family protein
MMLLLLRGIFLAVLCLTLMLLLLSATQILAAKIWLASWLPGARWLDEAELTAHADQWTHALLFTTLGGLAMAAWRSRSERQRLGWGLLGLAIATEILQAWVPGRSPSLADAGADALGLVAGGWLGWWALSRSQHLNENQGQKPC